MSVIDASLCHKLNKWICISTNGLNAQKGKCKVSGMLVIKIKSFCCPCSSPRISAFLFLFWLLSPTQSCHAHSPGGHSTRDKQHNHDIRLSISLLFFFPSSLRTKRNFSPSGFTSGNLSSWCHAVRLYRKSTWWHTDASQQSKPLFQPQHLWWWIGAI